MGKDLNGKELGTGIMQRKDGRYVGRFTNRFGQRQEVKSRDLKELKTLLNTAIYEDTNHMNLCKTSITLDKWFKTWMEHYKENTICANTKRRYMEIYRMHILPVLGKMKLLDITQLQILQLLKKMDAKGLQFESRNKVRILLQDMFDKAMINDMLYKNPAKGIKLGAHDKKEPRVLTPEEQASFFECSKGTFYDNLFVVAVSTGLRPGEVCALTLKDVDFKDALIRVNKTLVYQTFEGDEKKTFHFDKPKTKSSKREIPMNQQCALALKKQFMQRNVVMGRTTAKPTEGFEELIFTTKFGTPINTQTYSDAIKSVLENVNLCRDALEKIEYFSPHCFRHTFATRCFEAGIKPKTVQQYLGHATLQMTMDLYTHVLKEHSQEEMIKLEKVLDNTLDVSDATIQERYDKFQESENDTNKVVNKDTCKTQSKSKKNIVYLASVGT